LKPQIPWLRVFVEGVVIVASILLAVGIDAWWEGVQEREEEQAILAGLLLEFETHRGQLERRAIRNDTLVAGLVLLLEVSDDPAMSPPIDAMDRALLAARYASTWDPGSGERDALVSSGRLQLIRRVELRAALSGWGAVVDEVRDGETEMRNFVRESIIPHVASKGGPLGRTTAINREWPAPLTPVPEAEASYRDLFADPVFRALVQHKLTWQLNAGDEYAAAREVAGQILALVEAELGGAGVP